MPNKNVSLLLAVIWWRHRKRHSRCLLLAAEEQPARNLVQQQRTYVATDFQQVLNSGHKDMSLACQFSIKTIWFRKITITELSVLILSVYVSTNRYSDARNTCTALLLPVAISIMYLHFLLRYFIVFLTISKRIENLLKISHLILGVSTRCSAFKWSAT